MIELDELLNGTPTWEQVVEFWRDDGEFYGEQYLVPAIKKWLRTEDQRQRMAKADISIEEMLNGRYEGGERIGKVVQSIFDEWNAKLGFKAFGF